MAKGTTPIDIDALLKERLKELGSKGGKASANKLSKAERSAKAKSAAKARWAKAATPNEEAIGITAGKKRLKK